MSRRRKGPKVVRVTVMVLGVVALVGTMTTLAGAAPRGVTDKAARPSSGSLTRIDHVVVLMQENRSYDSYFSQLHFQGQPQASVESAKPNAYPLGGPPIHPFVTANSCTTADLEHGWDETHLEIDGGRMDGFTTQNLDPTDPTGSRTMGYYDHRTLPFYYGIANEFSVADRYFASVPGPTYPNRFYLLTGTSFGYVSNVTKSY